MLLTRKYDSTVIRPNNFLSSYRSDTEGTVVEKIRSFLPDGAKGEYIKPPARSTFNFSQRLLDATEDHNHSRHIWCLRECHFARSTGYLAGNHHVAPSLPHYDYMRHMIPALFSSPISELPSPWSVPILLVFILATRYFSLISPVCGRQFISISV